MSASFSMNVLFAVWWKTSSSATFCIYIAINLTHIGKGIDNMVNFKKLNSPKSVVLLERRFARGIWLLTRKPNCWFLFFLRKLDFLSGYFEKYPPFSRCFRARRALLNHLDRPGKNLWCHDVTQVDFRGARSGCHGNVTEFKAVIF